MADYFASRLARAMPRRLLYWAVIMAGVRFASANPQQEVPAIEYPALVQFLKAA